MQNSNTIHTQNLPILKHIIYLAISVNLYTTNKNVFMLNNVISFHVNALNSVKISYKN